MNLKTKYFFRLFVLFAGTIFLYIAFYFLFQSYDDFINLILKRAGKLDKLEKFKTGYLTYEKFQMIRYGIIILSLPVLFSAVKYYFGFEKRVLGFIKFICKGIKFEILRISKRDWYIFTFIFLISTIIKLYYFFTQPITNDEAFSFLNYIKPGFFAAISYYNLTNNHILHSLLCNFSDLLPVSPVYSLRITSFTAGTIGVFAAFVFFNKFLNNQAKFVALSFFAFSLPVLQYGILARGYSLLLLFMIISSFILIKLSKKRNNRKKRWAIFITASALGFYTLPVYIYVFASQICFYIIVSIHNKNTSYLKEFFLSSVITAILVGVLYAPIIFINGIDAFTNYDFMQALDFRIFLKNYFVFLPDYFIWITGNNPYFAIFSFFVLISGLVYAATKSKVLFVFILSFLIIPILIPVLQRIVPFQRLFVFNSLIIALSFGLFIEFLQKKTKFNKQKANFATIVLSIFISLILLSSFSKKCKEEKALNNKAYYFADLIDNHTSIFSTNKVRYYTFLKFKAMYLDKKQIKLIRENFDSKYPYDYISEDKDKQEQIAIHSAYKYSLIYEDEYIRLYKRSVAPLNDKVKIEP